MRFASLKISNFRNFEDLQIDLGNKCIFFGMNDIGKTNLLYAFRYVFDREIRKNDLVESDFHKLNTDKSINIQFEIEMHTDEDTECRECQILYSKLKGFIKSTSNRIYIRLTANYDNSAAIAIPTLFWGDDETKLLEMNHRGNGYYDIDNIFSTFYLDSYINMSQLFKKNVNKLIKSRESDKDDQTKKEIDHEIGKLNEKISEMTSVSSFEQDLNPAYNKFRNEKVEISIKSEISIDGLYSSIIPYIHKPGDVKAYPTSGDGRRKLISYSLYDLLSSKDSEEKITILLIEEPENHLHRSLQISLSKYLFSDENKSLTFVTTHSPYIFYNIEDVDLIRIYNPDKISANSHEYKITDTYHALKKTLNQTLSELLFCDKVFLVEGKSEQILFEHIYCELGFDIESYGYRIMPVEGVDFQPYYQIFNDLKIPVFIKTDNDVFKNSPNKPIGLNRCLKLINVESKNDFTYEINSVNKIKYYKNNIQTIDMLNEHGIYISKVDLENDLQEALGEQRLNEIAGTNDGLKYLKERKAKNLASVIKNIDKDDCKKIFEHENFKCLRDFIADLDG